MANDIVGLVSLLFNVLSIAIIGRALLSWFDPGMRSPVGKLLLDITEPIIRPIRQVVPNVGMFDISAIVALVLLQMLERLLVNALL